MTDSKEAFVALVTCRQPLGDQPVDHFANGRAVIGDQRRHPGLVDAGIGLDRIQRGELDRSDVEPGFAGAGGVNLGRMLVQPADQVASHVQCLHRAKFPAAQGTAPAPLCGVAEFRRIRKFTYLFD